jgi:site-specific DNA recombinase
MRVAAYARYSSDQQRAASLEDQLRNVRTWCQRNAVPDPVAYTDAAISGASDNRPGYRMLVAEITSGRIDLVVVDDLSRLSRDSSEIGQLLKRVRFAGARLVGVSDGVDTARKGHKIDVGLRGLMGEMYLDELADKTHRGLTGRALAGASAGGLPYGYRVAGTGQRIIDADQAAIVRRIYDMAAGGHTPRQIASALNAEGVPSPRGSSWAMSVIYGDRKRGIGILANPIYRGKQIWNRSTWTKHPDTGRRLRSERPENDWIITEHPELRIITDAQWQAADATLQNRRSRSGAPPGRSPRHMLSGLLKCCDCGGPMVAVDAYRYGCARAKDRGPTVCASRLRVARTHVESALLAGIKRDLLSEAAYHAFEREARRLLTQAAPDTGNIEKRIRDAERTRENIMAALKAGIITAGTRQALIDAEQGVTDARAELKAARNYQPAQILPRARETWRRLVEQLADARDTPEIRSAVRELLGDEIVLGEDAGGVFAEARNGSQILVVAGAGFEPTTFGL